MFYKKKLVLNSVFPLTHKKILLLTNIIQLITKLFYIFRSQINYCAMNTKAILYFACLFMFTGVIHAQLDFTSYYSNQNVKGLIEDGNNIWIGTRGGIYIRNKSTGTLVAKYNSNNGLTNSDVFDLAMDANGNKWIATWGGGVDKFDGSTFTNYNSENSGLDYNEIRKIEIDLQGEKWFASNAGAFRFDDSTWTKYTSGNGLLATLVKDIAVDTDGNIWFAHSTGITRFNKSSGTFSTFTTSDGLASDNTVALAVDPISGIVYAGGYSGEFSCYESGSWSVLASTSQLFCLTVYINGKVYAGTNSGAQEYSGGSWTTIGSIGGTNTLLFDALGNLWAGTSSNLHRYDFSTWVEFPKSSGILGNSVRDVEIDTDGSIWFGMYAAGVSCFDPATETWTNYEYTDGLAGSSVYDVLIDSDNSLYWFACNGGGVTKFDGVSSYTNYTNASTGGGLIANTVQAVALDSSGYYWFGTYSGASRFDGASDWSTYTNASTGGGLVGDRKSTRLNSSHYS